MNRETTTKTCQVCEILPQNNPVIENEHWMATLSPDQGYLGRSYVTLKEHKGGLSDLTSEEWQEFTELLSDFETRVRSTFEAELFNWSCLMNNAYQHTPAQPHVHWHVRPRYGKAVNFQDIEFTDPQFGSHYDREHRLQVSKKVLDGIADTLRSNS